MTQKMRVRDSFTLAASIDRDVLKAIRTITHFAAAPAREGTGPGGRFSFKYRVISSRR
jgi:hypothetical protein